jgi:hypothetical protein
MTKFIPPIVFVTKDYDGSLAVLVNLQGGIALDPELPSAFRFLVSAAEVRQMLLSIKPIASGIKDSAGEEILSFAIVAGPQEELATFTMRLHGRDAVRLYEGILASLSLENEEGRKIVKRQFDWALPPTCRKEVLNEKRKQQKSETFDQ